MDIMDLLSNTFGGALLVGPPAYILYLITRNNEINRKLKKKISVVVDNVHYSDNKIFGDLTITFENLNGIVLKDFVIVWTGYSKTDTRLATNLHREVPLIVYEKSHGETIHVKNFCFGEMNLNVSKIKCRVTSFTKC